MLKENVRYCENGQCRFFRWCEISTEINLFLAKRKNKEQHKSLEKENVYCVLIQKKFNCWWWQLALLWHTACECVCVYVCVRVYIFCVQNEGNVISSLFFVAFFLLLSNGMKMTMVLQWWSFFYSINNIHMMVTVTNSLLDFCFLHSRE